MSQVSHQDPGKERRSLPPLTTEIVRQDSVVRRRRVPVSPLPEIPHHPPPAETRSIPLGTGELGAVKRVKTRGFTKEGRGEPSFFTSGPDPSTSGTSEDLSVGAKEDQRGAGRTLRGSQGDTVRRSEAHQRHLGSRPRSLLW